MILRVQFQRLGHQYTMLCSVSNISATHDECQGILNCYIKCIIYKLCIHKSCCAQYPGFGAQESDIVKEATDQPKNCLDFTSRSLADIFWTIYNFS